MLAPRGGLLCPWPELLGSHGIPLKLRVFITVYFHLLVLNRTAGKKLPRSSHHHASGHKPGAQCRADDWTGWTLRTLTSSGFLLQTSLTLAGVRRSRGRASRCSPGQCRCFFLPKAQSTHCESERNCQEMEVPFGISLILISTSQMGNYEVWRNFQDLK